MSIAIWMSQYGFNNGFRIGFYNMDINKGVII